jgi:hypothetical protein
MQGRPLPEAPKEVERISKQSRRNGEGKTNQGPSCLPQLIRFITVPIRIDRKARNDPNELSDQLSCGLRQKSESGTKIVRRRKNAVEQRHSHAFAPTSRK